VLTLKEVAGSKQVLKPAGVDGERFLVVNPFSVPGFYFWKNLLEDDIKRKGLKNFFQSLDKNFQRKVF